MVDANRLHTGIVDRKARRMRTDESIGKIHNETVRVLQAGETGGYGPGALNGKIEATGNCVGADFAERLTEAGFSVIPVEYGLTDAERALYGIIADCFYRCTRK